MAAPSLPREVSNPSLEGELIACPDGRPDFYALGPRMAHTGRHARWAATQVPVTFVANLSPVSSPTSLTPSDRRDAQLGPLVPREALAETFAFPDARDA